jgi:multidrug efflux pump subunit AcrA (membrane-fusion protein)
MEAAVNAARQNNQAIASAQAALSAAQTNVGIAQQAVDDTVVRSPFAGYVSARPIAVGEFVSTANPLVTLLRTNPIKIVNLALRRRDHLAPATATRQIRRAHHRRLERIISINSIVNRRHSLAEQPRYEDPRKRSQYVRRRVFTDIREPHVNSSRPQTNGVTQSSVRIKADFNRGHTTIPAHMSKCVGEKFSYFIHCGNSERQTADSGD